jgi:hypothetical protein
VSIPDTHFMLDYVRADFIFLRVLAKHLIMWEAIPRTSEQVLTACMTDLLTKHCLSIRYDMPKSSATNKSSRPSKKQSAVDDEDAEMKHDSDAEEDEKHAEDGSPHDDDDSADQFSTPPT